MSPAAGDADIQRNVSHRLNELADPLYLSEFGRFVRRQVTGFGRDIVVDRQRSLAKIRVPLRDVGPRIVNSSGLRRRIIINYDPRGQIADRQAVRLRAYRRQIAQLPSLGVAGNGGLDLGAIESNAFSFPSAGQI